ncbi:Meckel syndrome type 1 protein [Lampris incognitus]|uniref:Meckel syndrome type 1 protein n=1 Tax=Lampris incognitus TaxID=2546036 RepID=UPI0024B55B7E|nr:Meckel syndrome type 1 protein [Lampris incognitus]
MAEGWNTDTGEAVYRSSDAIKNLKIRVCIEKVTSAAALSQHLEQQVLSQQERGLIELDTFTSQGQAGDNVEELVVGWQEKLFSQDEVDLFQDESHCQTPLERHYHAEIKALKRNKSRHNNRIFTYTDHDRYTNWLPVHQLHSQDLVTSTKATPTFLVERMANVRHRRQDRRAVDCSVNKMKMINWEPTEEFVTSSHVVNNAMQTMHIMGDLGPPGKLGQRENECLLLTIKTDGNGVVIVKPDFNKGKEPYRIETEGEKREVWRLTLENVSTPMNLEEKEREQHMYKDLYIRHREYLNSLIGQDFEMPPAGILRLLVNGEIVSAKGFEYDNLYIHFFMELPNNWSTLPSQSLTEVTQTCRTKTIGKDSVAFFSYPFSFEAFHMKEKESEGPLPQWPVLYFKVLSLDSWHCYRSEGYGYLVFPETPGKHIMTCHTWRPLQKGTVSGLRRFFIGGSPELEDYSYVRVPGTFTGQRLSRFGFCTETTGSVTFTLHCIQHARAFVDARLLKKRRQNVLDQLGGFSQEGAVYNILEAFQRARKRMQDARESLPTDLIHGTSQLQI